MKLFAVIGWGIRNKSASPAMHNASFRRKGFDAYYMAFDVPKGSLGCFTDLARFNLAGFNVTIPHKEEVLKYLDGAAADARAIGAVNTVKVERNLLVGYNTDYLAVYRLAGAHMAGAEVLVLGAGGAARAAAYAAVKAGAARITLANRTRERAEALARELAQKLGVEARGAGLGEAVRADVIINATPVWDTPLVDLRGARAYVEFVYNPPETALLREAKRLGLAVVDGIDILVEQGAAAEEIWGLEPDRTTMRRAAAEFLARPPG